MSDSFTVGSSQEIAEFTKNNNFGLTNFVHDITFGKGEISMLMTNIEMPKYFISNQIPVAFTNETGRTLKDGTYINQSLGNKAKEQSFLIRNFFHAARKMHLNYGDQVVHVAINEENCQHLFSLFFELPMHKFIHKVLNNGALIQDFIALYQLKCRALIDEAKKQENRVILPMSKALQMGSNKGPKCLIHKKTNAAIELPSQRRQCLYHLIAGKSAKQMAKIMQLSPKTIEYYLSLLRKELGCTTSKEIVSYYYKQIMELNSTP